MKPLPDNLKYAYLDDKNIYPVIISANLSAEEEEKLLDVLKAHPAIGYSLDDLKGPKRLNVVETEETAKRRKTEEKDHSRRIRWEHVKTGRKRWSECQKHGNRGRNG